MRLIRSVTLLAVVMLWGCPESSGGKSEEVGAPDVRGEVEEDLVVREVAADVAPEVFEEVVPEVDVPELEPLDEETAAVLQAVVDEFLAFAAQPGVVLTVWTGDDRWWGGGAGIADVGTGAPISPDMGFRIGSNSKPMIASLMLQLQEEGLVDLDVPITTYLPDYAEWGGITLRMCLSMQSGLPDYLNSETMWLEIFLDPSAKIVPELMVEHARLMDPEFAPGEKCAYNNTGYLLAGLIAEAVTGNEVEDELFNRFIEPLGLTDTYLDTKGEHVDSLVHGYMDVAIMSYALGMPLAALSFIPAEYFVDDFVVDTTYLFHPNVAWTAGGIVSSPEDTVVFMKALLLGKLLSADSLEQMMQFQSCYLLGGNVNYGLGLMKYSTAYGTGYGHGGLNFGYEAGTMYIPEEDLVFSHMHNYLPEQSGQLVAEVLPAVLDGVPESKEACVAPDGMWDGVEGPRLEVHFKGKVNKDGTLWPVPGLGSVKWYTDDKTLPLYGLYTRGLETKGFSNRLEVESLGPSTVPGFLRAATLTLDKKLAPADGSAAWLSYSVLAPYGLIAAVSEVELDPVSQEAVKLCIVAVSDSKRGFDVYLCENGGKQLGEGETLKLFGNVAVTDDPLEVEKMVSLIGIPVCMCPDENGKWGNCEL